MVNAAVMLETAVVCADEVARGVAAARQVGVDRGADPVHQVLYDYGVGIDCHSKFIQVCVLYQFCGQVRRAEKEFTTAWDDLVRAKAWAMEVLGPLAKPDVLRYCIESTGAYHMPVLRAWEGIPCVVNPLLAASAEDRRAGCPDVGSPQHYWGLEAQFYPCRECAGVACALGCSL